MAQSALAPGDSGGLWVLLGLRQGESFAPLGPGSQGFRV